MLTQPYIPTKAIEEPEASTEEFLRADTMVHLDSPLASRGLLVPFAVALVHVSMYAELGAPCKVSAQDGTVLIESGEGFLRTHADAMRDMLVQVRAALSIVVANLLRHPSPEYVASIIEGLIGAGFRVEPPESADSGTQDAEVAPTPVETAPASEGQPAEPEARAEQEAGPAAPQLAQAVLETPQVRVAVGDWVTFYDADTPSFLERVQIVEGPTDLAVGQLSKDDDVARMLLGLAEGESVPYTAGGHATHIVIKGIERLPAS